MHAHGDSASSTSSAEEGAYPWILEHILAYPGTYEIPLRTMYTLNSTPPAQQPPLHQQQQQPPSSQPPQQQQSRAGTPSLSSTPSSSPDNSPQSPEFPPNQAQQVLPQDATDHFKTCLMNHISQLPTQPFSLPPSFIASFVRKCFTNDLCLVDFTQALTAMDYLKDLETRRKRELRLVLQRLGLDKSDDGRTSPAMSNNPKVAEWVLGQQEKERKVEALYTQVYIGLRRWTLINEMRFEPFNKANCIAMLNTLYPPTTATPPTRQLTAAILSNQRNAFFRYITAVEKNGKTILTNLENQGQRKGDLNGWAVVREIVDKYLRTAIGVIDDCMDVAGIDYFDAESEAFRRNERRADSGVGFHNGDRPSTSDSGSNKSKSSMDKPLPKSPSRTAPPPPQQEAPCSPSLPATKKRGTFERMVRGIGNLRNRNDVKEMPGRKESWERSREELKDLAPSPSPCNSTSTTNTQNSSTSQPSASRNLNLRKMKSTSSIRHTSHHYNHNKAGSHSRSGSDEPMPDFDFDARRKELILSKQLEKENRAPVVGGGHRPLVAS